MHDTLACMATVKLYTQLYRLYSMPQNDVQYKLNIVLALKMQNPMEIAPHVTVDSEIHHGTPVITGTRVPVSIVIGSLAGGMEKHEVMQEYGLRKEQVEAALAYATDLVKQTQVVPLGA
ncbi:hypothetical protein NIES4071_09840 [Calothrix sp. NIES-4071]|nr:hypothetical protein NIES4071_09840 [Calothrix sp. NIES-4071]BAZ55326.1 hypothetical protein NIES4105_09800 [Calothrix sp. NIES-4105]